MKLHATIVTILFVWVLGADAQDRELIELGGFVLIPEIATRAVYDDRVITGASADGDYYSESYAGMRIENLPARYNVYADVLYGYRFYNEYDVFNDDFYNGGLGIESSRENPLTWGLSADYSKTLGYNTEVDLEDGTLPDPFLENSESRRFIAEGYVSYERFLTDTFSVLPSYGLIHYYQEAVDGFGTAEWQIHTGELELRKRLTEATSFFVNGSFSIQQNDDEDGYVGTVVAGVDSELTEKTFWAFEIGYAHADYELSGTGGGLVSALRLDWRATDKISVYAFGGNDFLPGYDGGSAFLIYRLGYGADWRALEKFRLSVSMLHDYQEAVDENAAPDPRQDDVHHFFNADATYFFTDHFSGGLGYSYVKDEFTPDLQLVYVELTYLF